MLSKKIGIDLGTSTVLFAGRTCGSSRGPTSLLPPRDIPNAWITRLTRAGAAGAYGAT